ncbi:hypothetical protein D3C75_590640 [compost metagenome]
MQGGFGIRALATDLNLRLFADGQPHQADQAVAGGRLAGEVQLRLTFETLCGLTDQRRRPRVQAATVSNAYEADNLCAGKLDIDLCGRCLSTNDVQQRLTDFHRFEGDGPRLKVLAVGEDQQADQAFALLRDLVQVVAQQGLAIGNPCAFLHQHRKALALQLDRVQAQVQEQFRAVVGTQGHRVTGAGDMHHHARARRMKGIVQRVDGDPVTHGAAGEHRVRDFCEREHRTAERGA